MRDAVGGVAVDINLTQRHGINDGNPVHGTQRHIGARRIRRSGNGSRGGPRIGGVHGDPRGDVLRDLVDDHHLAAAQRTKDVTPLRLELDGVAHLEFWRPAPVRAAAHVLRTGHGDVRKAKCYARRYPYPYGGRTAREDVGRRYRHGSAIGHRELDDQILDDIAKALAGRRAGVRIGKVRSGQRQHRPVDGIEFEVGRKDGRTGARRRKDRGIIKGGVELGDIPRLDLDVGSTNPRQRIVLGNLHDFQVALPNQQRHRKLTQRTQRGTNRGAKCPERHHRRGQPTVERIAQVDLALDLAECVIRAPAHHVQAGLRGAGIRL